MNQEPKDSKEPKETVNNKYQTFVKRLNEENRYLIEERAAVYEFCGGLPKALAEELAMEWWKEAIKR